MMKKLVVCLAISAATLIGGSAANASEPAVKAQATNDVAQADFSSHRRHYRHRYRVVHRIYRPYYRSYGYVPAPAYYAPAPVYYGGGPIISFGFGGGGWRGGGWGHHHHRHW
jgi:hypothetical protein